MARRPLKVTPPEVLSLDAIERFVVELNAALQVVSESLAAGEDTSTLVTRRELEDRGLFVSEGDEIDVTLPLIARGGLLVGEGGTGITSSTPRTVHQIALEEAERLLNANAGLIQVKVNGALIGTRHALNFIPGANITFTPVDDTANDEVDFTIAASGGGGGSVTSVAGGVGITNTPEPIIGAGTVDLDINSLTSEATLATGDLFPFVDVSVGTSPASQRKVTFANIESQLTLGNLAGTLGIGKGGTGQTAATAAFNALSPTTTEGDLITRDASNNVRLGIGANTRILQSNGSQPTWQAVSGDISLAFGGAATITNDAVSDAKLRNSGACSVVGRSANSAGDPADISASTNGHFLRRASDVVGFGAITTADLPSGINADTLDSLDSAAFLLLAGRAGAANDPILSTSTGGLLSGSSASGQNLDLQSTTHATKGLINLRDKVGLYTNMAGTISGNHVVMELNETSTIGSAQLRVLGLYGTYTASALATIMYGVDATPTVIQTGSNAVSTFTLFNGAPFLTSATAATPPLNPMIFDAQPTIRATDNDVGTVVDAWMLRARPIVRAITNADSKIVVTNLTGVEWFASLATDIAGATAEVTTARGFWGRNPSLTGAGTETLTNNFVIDIEAQGAGGTIAGLRNADRSVFTPSTTQVIDAAGDAILADATVVMVSNTTGGSLTLTSAPTIANGQDGQLLIIVSTGTQNVVIQDQGTLASSNLRLSAATVTLAPRDNIILVYSATVGDWVQIGQTNVI